MSIPLVGSPPPPPSYEDIVTGDSRNFYSSVGSWTATGGTLTHDTTTAYKLASWCGGSLKWVCTTIGQYISLPIAGTFIAGAEYQAVLYARTVSNAATGISFSAYLGLYGTDTNSTSTSGTATNYDDGYQTILIRWKPSATRTGVTLRFARSGPETGTTEWHLGRVRVARTLANTAGIALTTDVDSSTDVVLAAGNPFSIAHGLHYDDPAIELDEQWVALSSGGNAMVEVYKEMPLSGGFDGVGIYGGVAVGETNHEGINFEVGDDWVGLYISEKDAGTVQLYPDWGGGYDVELKDRGMGTHWKAVGTDVNRSVRLSQAIENPMTAVDDIIIGTSYPVNVDVRGPVSQRLEWVNTSLNQERTLTRSGTAQIDATFTGPVTVGYNVWYSVDSSPTGSTKTVEARLRRTNVTGTQLAIDTWSTSVSSRTGHDHQWTGSYVDNSPTDGKYILTLVATTGGATWNYVLSDETSITLSATGTGSATRLAKGNDNDVLTISPTTGHVSWQAPGLVSTVGPTGAYTLQLSDAGKVVELNSGSAQTLTIPESSSVAFPTGTSVGVYQAGAGQITVSPTGAAVLRAPNGAKTAAQYSTAQLRKRATDEWVLSGDTAV